MKAYTLFLFSKTSNFQTEAGTSSIFTNHCETSGSLVTISTSFVILFKTGVTHPREISFPAVVFLSAGPR